MRHMFLPMILGAFLLASCDANYKKAEVKRPVVQKSHTPTTAIQRDHNIDRVDRQAQEEAYLDNDSGLEAKTYNEKQISDDARTYPTEADDKSKTYNQQQ